MPVPYLLTILLFFPAVSAILTYVFGRNDRTAKWIGTGLSLVPLALSSYLVYTFLAVPGDLAVHTVGGRSYYAWEQYAWIPQVGISYTLGVDELSIFLVFLTTLLTTLAMAFSWDEHHRVRAFYAMFLFMETTILGVFLSLDFFLFFIFWEVGLVPMYFVIAVWGGPRKKYAAIKFFLYTQAASLLVLLGIFAMYFYSSQDPALRTFDMTVLIAQNPLGASGLTLVAGLVFVGFLVGFGTKLPSVPFHTWLPDAHVEAPTGGSVMLAGILLKLGGYGLFRVNWQMMEETAVQWWWLLALLGIVSIVYGSFVCLAQDDLKRLVAFSSVSHMGFVTLGLAAAASARGSIGGQLAFAGAIFQMFAHGLVSPALFMVAGAYGHKLGTRNISELGGVAKTMPTLTWFAVIAFLASLGLPGLVGFVAEFTVFLGVFAAWGFALAIPILTVVITAAYYIYAAQRAFFGPLNPKWEKAEDAHAYETVPLAILSVLFVVFGVLPLIFLQAIYAWSGAVVP